MHRDSEVLSICFAIFVVYEKSSEYDKTTLSGGNYEARCQ